MNPLDPIAAEPSLDELFRKTRAERTREDELLIIKRHREKRAALLEKREAADEEGDD